MLGHYAAFAISPNRLAQAKDFMQIDASVFFSPLIRLSFCKGSLTREIAQHYGLTNPSSSLPIYQFGASLYSYCQEHRCYLLEL